MKKNIIFMIIFIFLIIFIINANCFSEADNTILNKGIEQYEDGSFQDAGEIFRDTLKKNPESMTAKLYMAKTLYSMGNFNSALEFLDIALKQDPFNRELLIIKSQICFYINKYNDSISCLDRILEKKPSDTVALYDKGINYFIMKKYSEALKCFNLVIKTDPDYVDALYYIARVTYDQGDFKKTIYYCDKIIKMSSDDFKVWYYRAMAYEKLENSEEALLSYDKAMKINPDFYYSMAYHYKNIHYRICYDRLMKLTVLKAYSKDSQIKPLNDPKWFYEAEANEFRHEWQKAVECYDKAVKDNPKDYSLMIYKGICYEKLMNYIEAIRCYQKVLDIYAHDEIALNNMARSYEYIVKWLQQQNCYVGNLSITPLSQNESVSCGQTSVAMCINTLTGKKLKDYDIERNYGYNLLSALNRETNKSGYKWKDGGIITKKCWMLVKYKVDVEKTPVIVALNGPKFSPSGRGHIITLIKIMGDSVWYADPADGKIKKSTIEEMTDAPSHPDGNFIYYAVKTDGSRTHSIRYMLLCMK